MKKVLLYFLAFVTLFSFVACKEEPEVITPNYRVVVTQNSESNTFTAVLQDNGEAVEGAFIKYFLSENVDCDYPEYSEMLNYLGETAIGNNKIIFVEAYLSNRADEDLKDAKAYYVDDPKAYKIVIEQHVSDGTITPILMLGDKVVEEAYFSYGFDFDPEEDTLIQYKGDKVFIEDAETVYVEAFLTKDLAGEPVAETTEKITIKAPVYKIFYELPTTKDGKLTAALVYYDVADLDWEPVTDSRIEYAFDEDNFAILAEDGVTVPFAAKNVTLKGYINGVEDDVVEPVEECVDANAPLYRIYAQQYEKVELNGEIVSVVKAKLTSETLADFEAAKDFADLEAVEANDLYIEYQFDDGDWKVMTPAEYANGIIIPEGAEAIKLFAYKDTEDGPDYKAGTGELNIRVEIPEAKKFRIRIDESELAVNGNLKAEVVYSLKDNYKTAEAQVVDSSTYKLEYTVRDASAMPAMPFGPFAPAKKDYNPATGLHLDNTDVIVTFYLSNVDGTPKAGVDYESDNEFKITAEVPQYRIRFDNTHVSDKGLLKIELVYSLAKDFATAKAVDSDEYDLYLYELDYDEIPEFVRRFNANDYWPYDAYAEADGLRVESWDWYDVYATIANSTVKFNLADDTQYATYTVNQETPAYRIKLDKSGLEKDGTLKAYVVFGLESEYATATPITEDYVIRYYLDYDYDETDWMLYDAEKGIHVDHCNAEIYFEVYDEVVEGTRFINEWNLYNSYGWISEEVPEYRIRIDESELATKGDLKAELVYSLWKDYETADPVNSADYELGYNISTRWDHFNNEPYFADSSWKEDKDYKTVHLDTTDVYVAFNAWDVKAGEYYELENGWSYTYFNITDFVPQYRFVVDPTNLSVDGTLKVMLTYALAEDAATADPVDAYIYYGELPRWGQPDYSTFVPYDDAKGVKIADKGQKVVFTACRVADKENNDLRYELADGTGYYTYTVTDVVPQYRIIVDTTDIADNGILKAKVTYALAEDAATADPVDAYITYSTGFNSPAVEYDSTKGVKVANKGQKVTFVAKSAKASSTVLDSVIFTVGEEVPAYRIIVDQETGKDTGIINAKLSYAIESKANDASKVVEGARIEYSYHHDGPWYSVPADGVKVAYDEDNIHFRAYQSATAVDYVAKTTEDITVAQPYFSIEFEDMEDTINSIAIKVLYNEPWSDEVIEVYPTRNTITSADVNLNNIQVYYALELKTGELYGPNYIKNLCGLESIVNPEDTTKPYTKEYYLTEDGLCKQILVDPEADDGSFAWVDSYNSVDGVQPSISDKAIYAWATIDGFELIAANNAPIAVNDNVKAIQDKLNGLEVSYLRTYYDGDDVVYDFDYSYSTSPKKFAGEASSYEVSLPSGGYNFLTTMPERIVVVDGEEEPEFGGYIDSEDWFVGHGKIRNNDITENYYPAKGFGINVEDIISEDYTVAYYMYPENLTTTINSLKDLVEGFVPDTDMIEDVLNYVKNLLADHPTAINGNLKFTADDFYQIVNGIFWGFTEGTGPGTGYYVDAYCEETNGSDYYGLTVNAIADLIEYYHYDLEGPGDDFEQIKTRIETYLEGEGTSFAQALINKFMFNNETYDVVFEVFKNGRVIATKTVKFKTTELPTYVMYNSDTNKMEQFRPHYVDVDPRG